MRDHGPGVPPDDIERIFLPFHRVGASRDRHSGGAGLGLSIAARAARVHGGSISAVNAEDGGLEVTIDNPALQSFTFACCFLTARRSLRDYSGCVESRLEEDMQNNERKIGRREALALIGATGAALAAGCGSDLPTSPTATTAATDDGYDDNNYFNRRRCRHRCGVRRDAERDDRTVSLAGGPVPQRHPRRQERHTVGPGDHGREHHEQLHGADRRQCGDLAVRRERQLLAVRKRARADLSPRHSNDRRKRAGQVHNCLSRVVSGARHAHTRRGDAQRAVAQSHPDRVS